MKNKVLSALIPLKLQLFAEGGDGGDGGDGSGSGSGDGGNGSGSDVKLSFDDFLGQEGNQAEFDRRVQKATETALKNARKKWEALNDDRISEAEKLAKMTKEEKAEYLREKERKEFEKEKAEFEREKLSVQISKELASLSLPTELADTLVLIGDAEKIKEAMNGIKKVWDEQMQEALKRKARQDNPFVGGGSSGSVGSTVDIGAMAREARIIK